MQSDLRNFSHFEQFNFVFVSLENLKKESLLSHILLFLIEKEVKLTHFAHNFREETRLLHITNLNI